MRKLVTVGCVVASIVALVAPEVYARPRRHVERVAVQRYECPCGASAANQSWGVTLWENGGKSFETHPRERYLRISIDDDVSQTVHARVAQDTTAGDLDYEMVAHVCGETMEAIPITPGVDVNVSLFAGTCPDQSPSFPTTGVITVVFSNSP